MTTDPFAPSDDEHYSDDEALNNLDAFVSSLDTGKKRKANDDQDKPIDQASAPRKRRLLKAQTESGVENEFGAHAASGSKLRLEDLLEPLESTSSLQALKKSTKSLASGDALPAPLPTRTQERIDRAAAYEQTKEEVDKWKATMKRIKEADHLSFPLQVPQKINASNADLAAKFKPSNEMESAVDKLLRAANLRDEADITKTEELEMNHLSVEEVAQRRAELRKTRELLFRAEAKAKRVAKIKSKTYRKIQKKTREKMKDLLDSAEGDEGEEDVRLRHEVERALERATLRHKKTGKWAKAMKARGELEIGQRKEIEEMLEKGERLRAKIQGDKDEDGDEKEGSDDDRSNDGEEEEHAEVIEPKGKAHQGISSASTRRVRIASPVAQSSAGPSSNPWLRPRPDKKETGRRRSELVIDPPLVLVQSDATSQTVEKPKTDGNAGGLKAFAQRDLVAMAFAGDNVVQDFAKLKKREINEDAPREEDHTLPGWGSWGGRGVKHNPNAKKVIKKVAGVEPTARADHGKPHLIISEKRDKKAAKYLVKDLPYPYTSKAQFERSMETPIGTEWNTRVGFQRATLPKVVKKMGTVIDPLEKIF